jgi:predicted ATP-grasp superfamily ATP-dependent carboligase
MNKVIVIGGDHHNTLGVIRSLGEKGLNPHVVIVSMDGNSFVAKSKYIGILHIVRTCTEIVPLLLSHYKQENLKPVIICCTDASSSIIDIHSDELRPYFFLPGTLEQGQVTHLMNKQAMSELAISCGMEIPKTIYPTRYPLTNEEIVLPCIVKPLVSKDGAKEDIHICRQLSEVNNSLNHMGPDKVQIQSFIDKDFEYQLIGCSTGKDVIIPGVSRILRPCKGSNTSFLHYEPLGKSFCDLDACKEFVRKTGYKGLFSMEFLRDKEGKDFFLEINFRNDGNSICVTASGVNLPYIWYLSCIGENYREEANKQVVPKYVLPDSAEIRLLVTKQISIVQYLGDLFKTNRFMEFSWKDQRPFWKMIQMKFKYLWGKNI